MFRQIVVIALLILPVIGYSNAGFLKSFDVYFKDNKVAIVWETGVFSNNGKIEIERSLDASHFETIKTVEMDAAAGSMLYMEMDETPMEGTSHYRLKQTDENGLTIYSSIRTIKSYETLANELNFHPTPCDAKFNEYLKEISENEILVVLRNQEGIEYYSKVIITNDECTIEAMDKEESLPKGEYVVTASSKNELYSQVIKID